MSYIAGPNSGDTHKIFISLRCIHRLRQYKSPMFSRATEDRGVSDAAQVENEERKEEEESRGVFDGATESRI